MSFVFNVIVIVLFICNSFAVNAKLPMDSAALQNIDDELNQQPRLTYQKLQSQAGSLVNASPTDKLWWLLRKAQAENLLYLFSEFEQTLTDAQALINENSPDRLVINFDIFYGIILQRQGKYQQSQSLLKKAQQAAIKYKYTDLVVKAKLELAFTRSLTGLYEYSLTDLQQAYVEAFALGDNFLIAQINEVYGAIYGYLHDYSKSIEYYQKALISYQQLAYPAHEVEAIYGLAATYRYWQKYDLALDYYYRYQKAIAYSPNNIDGTFYALYGISMSLAGKGDCTQALIQIEKALAISGLVDYKAELYKRQALCFIKQNKVNQATSALDNAARIFATIPELEGTRWQLEVLKIRAQLTQAKGDNEQAYRLLEQFYQREIALLRKNSSDRLLRVRGAMEIERQNVEISLLQQRSEVHKLQLSQQKQENIIQTYIISFVVMLTLFGLIFIYFQGRHNKKLLALSIRDPLSDLYNRRYIFHFLNKVVSAVNSKKNQVSVMLIDIDDFKQVNDLYGHSFGDQVIREVAKIGTETIRVEDIIGRVGGEEFLCVLPRTDSIQCLNIAQRLVKKVHSHEFYIGDEASTKQQVNVTVSIGVSTTSIDTTNSADLYAQADKGLFHAKSTGKNRAVQYQSTMQHSYLKQD